MKTSKLEIIVNIHSKMDLMAVCHPTHGLCEETSQNEQVWNRLGGSSPYAAFLLSQTVAIATG